MTFYSERLVLSSWEPGEWTLLRPIATDPEVMRYINGGMPWTDDEIRGFVDRQVRCLAERGFCRWKLTERATGEMIGFCGVGYWRDALDPEIGWWLARHRWGCGFASEAAVFALQDAFERTALERIMSIAMPANTASRRIMEKLGLTFECDFDSGGVQLVRYAIHRSEYESRYGRRLADCGR